MPSIEERENLMGNFTPHYSGFRPRPMQKLTTLKKPRTTLSLECNHYLRSPNDEFAHGLDPLEYKMWQEAGKHNPPFPDKPDTNYNSNVWRNFRKNYGFTITADDHSISEAIAAMYPLNIPPPSKVGKNTFGKYIAETKLFNSEKYKGLALQRTTADVQEFKRLRLYSDARNPPIDQSGKILPPKNFKKYEQQFIPPQEDATSDTADMQRIDVFGQRSTQRSKPHFWKLSYQLNHPEFVRVKAEIEKRRTLLDYQQSQLSRVHPTPTAMQGHVLT